MKIFILIVCVFVLSARNAEALAPAPLVLITNAETDEITWRSPSLEAMSRPVVSMYRPHHKSPEQKWDEFWHDFDPSRNFRLVALPFLLFFLYHKREERREKQH